MGDTHSPKFDCATCGELFTDTNERLEHVMTIHAFIYGAQTSVMEYECFDCGDKVRSKQDLMSHKTEKYYKTRLCSYFHGNMTTCRFPAQQCMNIHNENIHPSAAPGSDYRSRIACKHGNSCFFRKRPSGCFYKHALNVETKENVHQQGSPTIANIQAGPGNVRPVERNQRPVLNTLGISALDMNHMILNLSKQMEYIVQKLQVLELKSHTDFLTVKESLRRKYIIKTKKLMKETKWKIE